VILQAVRCNQSPYGAKDSVRKLGPWAAEAVPDLIRALEDPSAGVREIAALGLASIGPSACGAAPALVAVLGDGSYELEDAAEAALKAMNPPAAIILDALTEAYRRPWDWTKIGGGRLRLNAVAKHALDQVSAKDADLAPALLVFITTMVLEDDIVVPGLSDGGDALARIGVAAAPVLHQAMQHDDARVRAHAAGALCEIDPDADAIAVLRDALRSSHESARLQALVGLGRAGAAARSVLPEMIQARDRDENEYVRRAAAHWIRTIESAVG
jgi:HEAT repeat protein